MTDQLTEHSLECAAQIAAINAARDAWAALWPNHCRDCQGEGCQGGYGSDYFTGEAEGDICFQCLDKGLCPRCGDPRLLSGTPCTCCGWTGKNEGDMMPPPREWPCDCEHAELIRNGGRFDWEILREETERLAVG